MSDKQEISDQEKMQLIDTLAQDFFEAFYSGRYSGDISLPIAELSLDEAYLVQDKVMEKRIEKGERVVGYKVGCTSPAIQKQCGLKEPIHGRLFQPHVYNEGIELYWNDYVNCGVEVEIVLALGKDLKDKNASDESLIDAIEYVSPVIEIHNFEFRFSPMTSQELISSNGIHACLVVGNSKVSPKNLSFQTEIFEIFKNSMLIDKAPASDILSGGGPLRSLRWLLGYLKTRNQYLKAGDFIIPGTPAVLVEIQEDTELSISVSRVGTITTKFKTRTRN